MGKKNVNPADAHRKKQRKKELEKNKATRKAAREMAVVHRDTTKTEREIERLQELAGQRQLDKNGQAKLKTLQEELEKVQKAKEAHGVKPQAVANNASEESRKLVFDPKKGAFVPISRKKQQRLDAKKARADRNEGSEDSDESSGSDDDSDNDSDNELLPELPVFKGEDLIEEEEAMKAKQIEENEVNQQHDETIEDAQQDAQVDAQEDIPMPEAESELVPGSEVVPRSEADEDEEEDSDIESIPMPKGPPPRKPFERQIPQEHQQQRLSRPPPPPPPGGPGRHYRPPPPNAYRPGPGGYRPPPPPPRPLHMQSQQHGPIPHYAAAATPQHYMAAVPGTLSREFSGMADSVTTVEGSTVVESSETPTTAAVTISAAPQVRDLQKELVGFVPAAVRKKQLQAGKKGTIPKVARPTINAAPDMDLGDTDELAPSSSIQLPTPSANNKKQGDEYERFMREMQGIL